MSVRTDPAKRLVDDFVARVDAQRDEGSGVELAEACKEGGPLGGGDVPFDHETNVEPGWKRGGTAHHRHA